MGQNVGIFIVKNGKWDSIEWLYCCCIEITTETQLVFSGAIFNSHLKVGLTFVSNYI